MFAIPQWLRRLAPLGPAGAVVAVPEDPTIARARELAGLLAFIDECRAEADGVLARAQARVSALNDAARKDAAAILEQASQQADVARETARRARHQAFVAERDSLLAASHVQADAIRSAGREQSEAVAAAATELLRSWADHASGGGEP